MNKWWYCDGNLARSDLTRNPFSLSFVHTSLLICIALYCEGSCNIRGRRRRRRRSNNINIGRWWHQKVNWARSRSRSMWTIRRRTSGSVLCELLSRQQCYHFASVWWRQVWQACNRKHEKDIPKLGCCRCVQSRNITGWRQHTLHHTATSKEASIVMAIQYIIGGISRMCMYWKAHVKRNSENDYIIVLYNKTYYGLLSVQYF